MLDDLDFATFAERFIDPDLLPQWRDDIAAFHELVSQQHLLPFRLGDLFNTLQSRWEERTPLLAEIAGLPFHTALRCARVAAAIPAESPLRALGLPFPVLDLLAPLEATKQQEWAERASALQEAGRLRAREFARLLADEGLRPRRAPRVPQCLQCGGEAAEGTGRVRVCGEGEKAGWVCGPRCGRDWFAAREPAASGAASRPTTEGERPARPAPADESALPVPSPGPRGADLPVGEPARPQPGATAGGALAARPGVAPATRPKRRSGVGRRGRASRRSKAKAAAHGGRAPPGR